MLGLPNPYVILASAGLWAASLIGAAAFWGHHVKQGYELRLAQEQAAGQAALAVVSAKHFAAEQAQEARNNEIEAQHAKDQAVIDDAYVAYADAIGKRVQPYRQCPGNTSRPAEAIHTGGGKGDPSTAIVGLFVPQASLNDLGKLAAEADEWVAYGHACHDWAVSVGR